MNPNLPPQQTSILDDEPYQSSVKRLVLAGETNATVVHELSVTTGLITTTDSIRRFRKRHNLNIPGTEPGYTRIRGDEAEGLCKPSHKILTDPDRMLQDRGLDPVDWYVDDITVNEWDGLQKGGLNKTKLYQTKFRAKRKRPYNGLMPVRSDGWIAPKKTRWYTGNAPELVAVCGDFQTPFLDVRLNEIFCEWLSTNTPQRGVNLGDLHDMPDISRHPPDPENVAFANECLQSGYDTVRGHIVASPNTEWALLPGNHDHERIRAYLLNHAPALYGLKRVDSPTEQGTVVHSIEHLLRLDELGVRYHEPHGTYEDAQVTLSKNLAVRHGWIVRQGSGTSALKTLEQTGYSILIGHTHRQSIVHHTVHDIDRRPTTLLAAEIGCMCRMDSVRDHKQRRFPSYTVMPDWQQGWASATIWPDGKFRIDLATYVNGVLLYRDQRYA